MLVLLLVTGAGSASGYWFLVTDIGSGCWSWILVTGYLLLVLLLALV